MRWRGCRKEVYFLGSSFDGALDISPTFLAPRSPKVGIVEGAPPPRPYPHLSPPETPASMMIPPLPPATAYLSSTLAPICTITPVANLHRSSRRHQYDKDSSTSPTRSPKSLLYTSSSHYT
ncbi:hypothetical protein D9619_012442 [Psilocybe cf. subviscida]|uniref:Uncharacterized protein n=1 Tax=Psilocybe cf. subviscida TaxID=2480587 RepID=A0A8H5ARH8_9AGAR|nr:hypothetical protein D9619_012442 [Psilocybe cf. subviscida]